MVEPVETQVPDSLDEALSPAWLTAALGTRYPGVNVTAVDAGPVDERVTTNARFRISGDLPDGLPQNLCVKGYFSDYARPGRAAGLPEMRFYRDGLHLVGIRSLNPVWVGIDERTSNSVLITEDVIAAGGTFLDAHAPYTPDMAATLLSDLATLHATTWCDPRFEWLGKDGMARRLRVRGEPEIRANFEGPVGAGVPAEIRDPRLLIDAYTAMAQQNLAATEWCVIHGDPHPGNVFVDAAGRPALLDWQLVQRATWFHDVGYHLCAALTVEDRRDHEEELLRHYLAELQARGGDAPALAEAFALLRHGILLGLFLWGITVRVEPSITTELLTRLGTAALDHHVLAQRVVDAGA